MIKKILVLLAFSLSIKAYSTVIDSTLYNSDFELDIFQKVIHSQPYSSIDLFLAMDYTNNSVNYKNEVAQFIQKLVIELSDIKNEKKRLKLIYKRVHEHYFKKYEEVAFFNDIFTSGTYNCATATALYAYVLEEMGIDFVIKETPTHVYLIANPAKTSFIIETTLPSNGIYYFDNRFKQNFINYLHDNKIISDSEYRTKSLDDLFASFYLSDRSINLKELAGLHYYNKAVANLDDKKNAEALRNIEKAELLYPSNAIKYVRSGAAELVLNDEITTKKYNGRTLAVYLNSNIGNAGVMHNCQVFFGEISEELLVNHPDLDRYSTFYDQFIHNVSDSVDKSSFSQDFYNLVAYYYYNRNNYNQALGYYSKAYQLNGDNTRTQHLISELLSKKISINPNENNILDTLDFYAVKFPFIKQEANFQQMFYFGSIQAISNDCEHDSIDQALAKLDVLVKRYRKHLDASESEMMVAGAYQVVASYYYRQRKYNDARKIYEDGMAVCPNSVDLKRSLESITDAGNAKYYQPEVKKVNYDEVVAQVEKDKKLINARIDNYLLGLWSVEFKNTSGVLSGILAGKSVQFNIKNNQFFLCITKEGTSMGSWTYNTANCTLNFKFGKTDSIDCLVYYVGKDMV